MLGPSVFIVSTTSIDGKIRGLKAGERLSHLYQMPKDVLVEIHKLRSQFDAIMVGANTVRLDNPKLTVRYIKTRKKPWRITISRKSDFNLNSNIFDKAAPSLLITTKNAPLEKLSKLEKMGVKVFIEGEKIVDFKKAFVNLGNLGIKRIMIEGGPTLITSLINQRLVQNLTLITYPVILGDGDAIPSLINQKLKQVVKARLYKYYEIKNFAFRFYKLIY